MKKRISVMLALIVAAITLLSTVPAFALTEGTKYSFTEKYLNAYYDTGSWQTANGDYHDDHGQVALRNLTSTGEPIYCMQIYNGTNGDAATAKSIDKTNLWNDEYSSNAQDIVRHVSIWGCPNYTYGYSKDNAQLATQVLIWEAETGKRTNYSTTATSFANSIFSNYPDAKKCYTSILEACSSHSKVPTFNPTTVTLSGTGEENAKYVDVTLPSGVKWDQFNLSDASGALKTYFSASNNKLKIWCTKEGKYNTTLTLTKKNTDLNTAYALTGANQTMFYGTLSDPVQTNFRVNIDTVKYCRVTVCKRDAADHSKILDGAVFMLQQWSESSQSWQYLVTLLTTTMSDGTVRYVYPNGGGNNLLVYTNDNKGKFKLIERSAPAGYENSPIYSIGYQQSDHTYEDEHINTATGEFTFDPNSVVNNFQFYFLADDPQEGGSCKIIKTSDDDKVSGIQFTVTGEGFYYEIYKIIRKREVFCTVSDKAR